MENKKRKKANILKNVLLSLRRFFSFFLLLVVYLGNKAMFGILKFLRIRPQRFPKIYTLIKSVYVKSSDILDHKTKGNISTYDLIELSFRNLKLKKARTIVTIGGMTIGIAAVVFLVSIGYGLQDLVISRVAKLDEMKQIEVSPQPGSRVRINDESIASIKNISTVDSVLPLIAVVGRVNYQNSASDVAVYGVTNDYLEQSAIKPSSGKIFESNETVVTDSKDVKGEKDKPILGKYLGNIGPIEVEIPENKWIEVRKSPDEDSKLLGYVRRPEGVLQATEVWGKSYESSDGVGTSGIDSKDNSLGKWISYKGYMWKRVDCTTLNDAYCVDEQYTSILGKDNKLTQLSGYFMEIGVTVKSTESKTSSVLGDSTINWVDIPSESEAEKELDIVRIDLPTGVDREAVVNTSMINVLGIKPSDAVGEKIGISFVVIGELLEDSKQRIESTETQYTIIGVIPDEQAPVIYIPFVDVRSLGVVNYSQLKITVKNESDLNNTRAQIEGMGYNTASVIDTVNQITNLFATLRTILALVGMVALAVAALGMFNTLTVSLLERTREVGLMKAMGMKSSEIQELFLTESMIIGFFGGILGIFAAFLGGKLLSIVLSLFTLFRGAGFVDVAKIPILFTVTIIIISLVVGVITGIYPARRATKISALDALRYE